MVQPKRSHRLHHGEETFYYRESKGLGSESSRPDGGSVALAAVWPSLPAMIRPGDRLRAAKKRLDAGR